MAQPNDKSLVKKLKEIVLDVDPEGIFRDARAAGLEVTKVEDFRYQVHNYWRIEDLMRQYASRAARFSAGRRSTTLLPEEPPIRCWMGSKMIISERGRA